MSGPARAERRLRRLLSWNGVPLARFHDKDARGARAGADAPALSPALPPPITSWRQLIAVCCAVPPGRGTPFPGAERRVIALRRAFFELRCGVFVRVANRRVQAFVPFCNTRYQNRWHGRARYRTGTLFGPGASTSCAETTGAAAWVRACRDRGEPVLEEEASWWCNGAVLCNQPPKGRLVWGDTYLYHLLWMLVQAAEELPEAAVLEFLVNKRDFPQTRVDGRDPYAFMYTPHDPPRTRWPATLPTLSFYGGDEFSDLLIPTTDDVEAAWPALSFPPHYKDSREFAAVQLKSASRDDTHILREREPRAFFRGSATGRGVTVDTNQRLALAAFARQRPDLLDAKLTGWNARDKVQPDGTVARIQPGAPELRGLRGDFVPMPKQRGYAMHLYVDGHCAASRLGAMLALGGVILRVRSLPGVPGTLWLDQELPWAGARAPDVSADLADMKACWLWIDPDLGNLEETIAFVRSHPEIAAALSRNARTAAASRVSPRGIVTRVRSVLLECWAK